MSGLAGVRVIDFGQYLAGPLAAMLLADHGADVIRVDPPGGPRWRHPANAVLQRNKRSIVLDLRTDDDRDVARRLVGSADVVIEGFRPGVMERLGLPPDELVAQHPQLIWCSLPGFGRDDPRAGLAGWEGIICSAAGLYPPTFFATTGGPRFSAIPHASNFAAFVAAHSIVAALIARHRFGHGDHIEIPLFDAAFEVVGISAEEPFSVDMGAFHRELSARGIANPADKLAYRCRDGRLLVRALPLRGLHKFWDEHLPPGLKDATDPDAVARAAELLGELFASRDAEEWERHAQAELGAACAVHQSSTEWLHDDHAIASRCVVRVDDPEVGPTLQAGFAVELGASRPAVRHGRRRPGADDADIRRELAAGPRPGATVPARRSRGSIATALAGVRVLDFSFLLAGPAGTRILAEYGADVIKVDRAAVGRGAIDPASDEPITFIGYRTTGAGKRSMFLDLKAARGRVIAHELVRSADVVHHNFTPAAAERIGLGEPELREIRADLVYSTVNVHARGGWRGHHRGHEILGQAVTGVTVRYGGPDAPAGASIAMNDQGTGHLSAFGILVALYHRMRTGEGDRVEAALSRTATVSQVPYMIDHGVGAPDGPAGPEANGWDGLDRLYQSADGWLYVVARGPDGLARLRDVEGLESLHGVAGSELEAALERCVREAQTDAWIRRFARAGVPAHPYRDIAELIDDPVVRARRLVVDRAHPGIGWGRGVGLVARFASAPDRDVRAPARPGWHTEEVLAELGHDDRDVAVLLADGVVAGPMVSGTLFVEGPR